MPICKKCKTEKDDSEFYLNKENGKPYGTCSVCWQERTRLLRLVKQGRALMPKTEDEIALESGVKTCHKCEQPKSLQEFRFDQKLGRHLHECKNCSSLRQKIHQEKIKLARPPRKTTKEKTLERGYKVCSKCNDQKDLSNFSLTDSRSDGFHSLCKNCESNAREEARRKAKIWATNNKEKRKTYQTLNKEERAAYMKEWRQKRREHRRIYRRNYNRHRKATDINFKILYTLRSRLLQAIKKNVKAKSAIKLLGCTIDFFKEHMAAKFREGMTWQNHGKGAGKWHIDHIIPCSAFDMSRKEEQIKCFHYTNLQPLWEYENLSKNAKTINQIGQNPRLPENGESHPACSSESAQLPSSQYTDPCF